MSTQLFALRVPNDMKTLRVIAGALRATLAEQKLKSKEINQLELVVEEACANVIDHAYDKGAKETFDVECYSEFGALRIRIKDHGKPFDPLKRAKYDPTNPESKGLGFHLMLKLAHEVRFIKLGEDGKAFDIIYRLPGFLEPPTTSEPKTQVAKTPIKKAGIRKFKKEDARNVSLQAYHALNYSPFGEHLYVPRHLIEMVEKGALSSYVISSGDGKVYGHAALKVHEDRGIPEICQAFVAAPARKGSALRQLLNALYKEAGAKKFPGVTVTSHVAPNDLQIACKDSAARVCAIMPSYMPLKHSNKPQRVGARRSPVLIHYRPMNVNQKVNVKGYVPNKHRDIIRDTYESMGMKLQILPSAGKGRQSGNTEIRVTWNPIMGTAHLVGERAGFDLKEVLQQKIQALQEHNVTVIVLDLPTNNAAMMRLVPTIEKLGFFYSGIIPNFLPDADVVRMQYLHSDQGVTSSFELESAFAQDLLAYIQEEMLHAEAWKKNPRRAKR